MAVQLTPRIASTSNAVVAAKDPQAAFQEKLGGYLTRHIHAGTVSQLPAALRKAVSTPGNSFDSSVLLPSKGSVNGVAQPAIAIIDIKTAPNPELVLHHPRKPNDGYVLLAGAVGAQKPLAISDAIDISTPAMAALKAKLKGDTAFNAALTRAGFQFSDVKIVVGDAIGKKDGAEFAGEFTDAGAGRYGVYVPGKNGKPAFAENFIVKTNVTQIKDASGKTALKATIGSIKEEKA